MRLLYPADLINMPPPQWIIKEVMQKDSTALLYGPPGLGKSFVALEIAFAVASNRDDIFTVEHPGPVVYVAGEGVTGIGVRVKAWQIDRKTELDKNVAVLGEPVQLADRKSREKFIKLLSDEVGEPTLIIFDTLARCAVGMDENSAKDMGMVVDGVEKIRAKFGCALLLVHHSTKANAKTERGSGAVYGAVDTAFSLSSDGKHYIKLECQKQKNGEAPRVRSLELRPVEDISCVISADKEAKAQTTREKYIDTMQRGTKNGFTKAQFYDYTYPPPVWEWDGRVPVISVADPGGKRIMLEAVETDDPEFLEWLEGPKADLAFLSFPADTDWAQREQHLMDRKAGRIKSLRPEAELAFWFNAVECKAVTQTQVAEWYGLPRTTFVRYYKEWKTK